MVSSGVSRITGHIVKTGILHETAKEINTNQPLSDTVMTVYPAAQWFL